MCLSWHYLISLSCMASPRTALIAGTKGDELGEVFLPAASTPTASAAGASATVSVLSISVTGSSGRWSSGLSGLEQVRVLGKTESTDLYLLALRGLAPHDDYINSEPQADGIRAVPFSRWDAHAIPGGEIIFHGGFLLDSIEHFDASALSISAAEATAMDPQQRLLQERVLERFGPSTPS